MRLLRKILLGFCAAFILAGCMHRVVYVPRVERVEVPVAVQTPLPAELIEGCYEPEMPARRLFNSDLVAWIDAAKLVIQTCHQRFVEVQRLQP